MPWITIMTRPNCEVLAAENLQRQGFTYYCPRFKLERPAKAAVIRPLFPRYMFVLVEQAWYSIRGTRGVSLILTAEGGKPQYIPASIIDNLRSREGPDGLVNLTPPPRFSVGSKVKCEGGPLAGHALIYAGMSAKDRVNVLIEMLGRQVKVDVPESELVAA